MTVEYRLETVYDVNVLNCYIGLVMKLVQKLRLWNFMFSLFYRDAFVYQRQAYIATIRSISARI